MAYGKYFMTLAVVAGVSLFLIGAYAIERSSDDNGNDPGSDLVQVTLSIGEGLVVTYDEVTIVSDVSFYVSDDVGLKITIPETGLCSMIYVDSGQGGGSGEWEEFGHAGDVLETTIVVLSPPFSENITGSITFTAQS
ncbi:MAG: hypothetical protein FWG60_01030 [Methanomassiliicoccaceae archaeon]|nr:hypothetical protein [Methanomassiliicoccaceae archaeon]